jgi:hypothetical protein
MLALRSVRAKDPDAAIKILTDSLTNTEEDVFTWEMIAHWHCTAGRDAMAIAAAKQALSYSPSYFGALELLAGLHASRSEHELAAHYARLGLENFPERLPNLPQSLVRGVQGLFRLLSLVSRRFQRVADEDIPDPNRSNEEWYTWAKQYLEWYDDSHGQRENPRVH